MPQCVRRASGLQHIDTHTYIYTHTHIDIVFIYIYAPLKSLPFSMLDQALLGINFDAGIVCKRLQWLTGLQTCHNINQLIKNVATLQ